MKQPINSSSWISEVLYRSTKSGQSFLGIFKVTTPGSEPEAMLYGPNVPSHIPGLLQAGLGGLSVGKAYHAHIKGKYDYTKVVGAVEVAKLRNMLITGEV
jgi:hypothetical protein